MDQKISSVIAAQKLTLGQNLDTTEVYSGKIPNEKSSIRFLSKVGSKVAKKIIPHGHNLAELPTAAVLLYKLIVLRVIVSH